MSPAIVQALREQLLRTLPSNYRIHLLIVEHADGSTTDLVTSSPDDDTAPVSTRGHTSAQEDVVLKRRDGETLSSCLLRIRRELGAISLKPARWATAVGIEAGELKRAISSGAIRSSKKLDGRDHGATLVAVGDLLAYAAQMEAVERGEMAGPVWSAEAQDQIAVSPKCSASGRAMRDHRSRGYTR
jgi:hypothetical protein